ncbi:MAG: carboxylesterase family protein [Acholeplasmatales bacterium]|nr:carboxylesterase family protein [Acholeplasmatales bacterium]
MSKRRIVLEILFCILMLLVFGVIIFYLDLANGPLVLFVFELIVIVAYIVLRILYAKAKLRKRLILFACFSVLTILILSFARPKEAIKSAVKYDNPVKTDVLEIENGKIQGVYNENKDVLVYAGIPYAKPPVGDLRWKEPQDLDNWDGVLDCSQFKPMSYQPRNSAVTSSLVNMYAEGAWHPNYISTDLEPMSEDSLYLNVWRPNTDKTDLPILIFIHGGSLTTGSAAFDDYNGEEMAKTGVIMVTIQYRLGIFGYFAHQDLIDESSNNTTGNYGLLDQIKAIKWVNDNAKYFGGDVNNITVAGESAGSSSVSAICTSKLAKGLFKKAIGESSSLVVKKPPHTYRELNDALDTGNKIMDEFNAKSISDLRKVDASKLVKTKYSNDRMTLDGYALEKNPYDVYLDNDNNEEILLNGYNIKEADAFVIPKYLFSPTNKNNIEERLKTLFDSNTTKKILDLYKDKIKEDAFSAFNEIISVWWFIYPHHSWSRAAYNSNTTVYRYQFTKENGYYGTYHSGEMIYAYGNVYKSPYDYRYNDSDIELSSKMLGYWSNFAKYGNPNSSGLPNWEIWENKDNQVMELGSNVGMIKDKYLELYDIFDHFLEV